MKSKVYKRSGSPNLPRVDRSIIKTWMDSVSESSRPRYQFALQKYSEFTRKTPSQLIAQRDSELRINDYNKRTGVRDSLIRFREYLESQGYAPKSINSIDGAVRGLFTAILGRSAMINIKNYCDSYLVKHRDIVPTLTELRKMLEVCNIEDKFRVIFLAQTGMRIGDALALNLGIIRREMDLGQLPMAIRYLPSKRRESIGERVTFLGSDGVTVLEKYLKWRGFQGEVLRKDSPLFASRTKRGHKPVTAQKVNETIRKLAKITGLVKDTKVERVRAHSLRKFFVTQLTDHGIQDKVVNYLIGHTIPEVDLVYWDRRVEELRRIYSEVEQYLNPLSVKTVSSVPSLKDVKRRVDVLELKMEIMLREFLKINK